MNSQTGRWGTAYEAIDAVASIAVQNQATRTTSEERFHVTIENRQVLKTWVLGGYAVKFNEKQL